MKKLVSMILAAVMAASLVACGSTSTTGTTSTASTTSTTSTASSTTATADASSDSEYVPPSSVTLVVPYSAGGANDLLARLVAKHAAKFTDCELVVTNVDGGSGTLGLADVLKRDADGTYMVAAIGTTAFVSTDDKPLTFDYLEEFSFISMFAQDQRVIVALKDNGKFTNLEEFMDYAAANPGDIVMTSTGAGTVSHFVPQMLADAAGVDITIVPFDGGAEQKADLLGGHSDAASLSYSEILSLDTDQLIILGTANSERPAVLPDVPTFQEQGYDVVFTIPRGYAMKAGTDEAAIAYWSDIFELIASDSEFIAESEDIGYPVTYKNYVDFTDVIVTTQTAFDLMLNG